MSATLTTKINQQSSYGALSVDSTVANWVVVSQPEAYYANGDRGLTTMTHNLLAEALDLVDSSINFGNFDDDNNNMIDSVTFLHSGYVS